MFVVQAEERNMYDQHWLSAVLKERYPFYVYDTPMCKRYHMGRKYILSITTWHLLYFVSLNLY
jgi:hypothetical protein